MKNINGVQLGKKDIKLLKKIKQAVRKTVSSSGAKELPERT
ncbi:MAG: hypothetical protein ACE5J5_08260 [Candidatus Hydrothermarchaeales archaeon]